MVFADRDDAGRQLAERLRGLEQERPLVVALPRGGVPVGLEVARALNAPLDILAVRKLGAPRNPELGVGAIAEDGTAVIDTETARFVGMTQELLQETVDREVRELHRRVDRYRGGRPPLDPRGRTVIVVDDGLATGLTDLAAVRALRAAGARRIVVAVPVGAPESIARVNREADDVVSVLEPDDLRGVGRWYQDFSAVDDATVLALLESARGAEASATRELRFVFGSAEVAGDLTIVPGAHGIVIFAHGSGSSRRSPRNRAVAAALGEDGFATLLFDLLSEREALRRELVFDSPLLADRLVAVTRWAQADGQTRGLPIGYFGASTGAAAALRAAAALGEEVGAVVSRGGRADLAGPMLPLVTAATLLIVGSLDRDVLALNRRAAERLRAPHRIAVVEGAGHLFEEPGALDEVTRLASGWFSDHLVAPSPPLAAVGG